MKKLFLFIMVALTGAFYANAQKAPSWVSQRPISDKDYIGIGMASTSDDNYMDKAKQNALADIASQIATKVDAEAFIHTVDVDGKSRELFEEKITGTMSAWVEGIEIKDTYTGDGKHYVYCTLNKELYRKNAEARRSDAIQKGSDYLKKGRTAEEELNLTQALFLYGKGLEAVEPWIFMDLNTTIDGEKVNLPAELYNAYVSIFGGMAITTNVNNIEAEAFKVINIPLAACLSKNGEVVPNVKLKAWFVRGEGTITPPIETDINGTSEFYVTNITSKDKVQEIRIAIDDSFTSTLPQTYQELLKKQSLPVAKVTVSLAKGATTAYVYASDQNDLEGIEKKISSLISKDFFKLTEDADNADCLVEVSSSLDMGNVISGASNLNTNYCTVTVKVYNNHTDELVLDYSVERVKALSPTDATVNETLSLCINEVMKRVKRNLPTKLKNMNL